MNIEIAHQIRRFLTSAELRNACLSHVEDTQALRDEFARFVASHSRYVEQYSCWQHAWNSWTRAQPGRPGSIRLTQRCPRCNGKKVDLRRGTFCMECHARGSVQTYVRTRYLEVGVRDAPDAIHDQ